MGNGYKLEVLGEAGEVLREEVVPRFQVFGEHHGHLDDVERFRLTHTDEAGEPYGDPDEFRIGTAEQVAAIISTPGVPNYFLESTKEDPPGTRYITSIPPRRVERERRFA
jgi:hypothetical protein